MLLDERRRRVVEIVTDRNGCRVEELATELDVSEATIRRDLQDLNERNLIDRTHGGAMPVVNRGLGYEQRKIKNLEQKAAIADRAIEEMHQEQVVFFDAGSTTLEVSRRIPNDLSFVAVTNTPRIARELAEKEVEVQLTGGWFKTESYSVVGPWTEKFIQSLNFDLLFLGTDGIHPEDGLTTQNVQQAHVKELMIGNARRVVLIADGSKMGKRNFVHLADFSDIDLIITDGVLPDSIKESFTAAGVEIIENVYDGR